MSKDPNQAPRTKIILVHGFLDDGTAFVPSRRDFEAVALDLPGSGPHLNDEGPFTLRRLAESVIAEIDRTSDPVVLVGQIMGAQLRELTAASRPGRVAGLVLLTPVPSRAPTSRGTPPTPSAPWEEPPTPNGRDDSAFPRPSPRVLLKPCSPREQHATNPRRALGEQRHRSLNEGGPSVRARDLHRTCLTHPSSHNCRGQRPDNPH